MRKIIFILIFCNLLFGCVKIVQVKAIALKSMEAPSYLTNKKYNTLFQDIETGKEFWQGTDKNYGREGESKVHKIERIISYPDF